MSDILLYDHSEAQFAEPRMPFSSTPAFPATGAAPSSSSSAQPRFKADAFTLYATHLETNFCNNI